MIITGRNVNLSLSFSPRVVGQFLPKIPIIFWIEHIVPLRAVAQVVIAVYQLVLFNIFLIHPMMVHKRAARQRLCFHAGSKEFVSHYLAWSREINHYQSSFSTSALP